MPHVQDEIRTAAWVRAGWLGGGVVAMAVLVAAVLGYDVPRSEWTLQIAGLLLIAPVWLAASRSALLLSCVRVRSGVLTAPLVQGDARIDLHRLRLVDCRTVWGRGPDILVVRLVGEGGTVRLCFTEREQMLPEHGRALWQALAADGVPVTARARERLGLPGAALREPPADPVVAWLIVGAVLFTVLLALS